MSYCFGLIAIDWPKAICYMDSRFTLMCLCPTFLFGYFTVLYEYDTLMLKCNIKINKNITYRIKYINVSNILSWIDLTIHISVSCSYFFLCYIVLKCYINFDTFVYLFIQFWHICIMFILFFISYHVFNFFFCIM